MIIIRLTKIIKDLVRIHPRHISGLWYNTYSKWWLSLDAYVCTYVFSCPAKEILNGIIHMHYIWILYGYLYAFLSLIVTYHHQKSVHYLFANDDVASKVIVYLSLFIKTNVFEKPRISLFSLSCIFVGWYAINFDWLHTFQVLQSRFQNC